MNNKINSKQKGNTFERKIAKELSIWMFNDENILKRHPTSGMDKCIWTGDVVPMAQLLDEWNNEFPIHIECKTGYKDDTPDFWNYKKIISWFNKSRKECVLNKQNIIYLICRFKNRSIILITNQMIMSLNYKLILLDDNNNMLFVYNYNDLLKTNFNDIFNSQIKIT